MRTFATLATGLLAWSGALAAADLEVQVADTRGRPVADAVVTLEPLAGHRRWSGASSTHTIDQLGLVFVPYLQVFRPGDSVVFRNSDRTRHHVYSFSATRSFEYMLKPGERSPPLVLDATGAIAAGCNIHDAMITYLFVTDAPWYAQTGPTGRVRLANLPKETLVVRVWHPRLRPGRIPAPLQRVPGASGQAPLEFRLMLLPDPRRRADPEQSGY